MNLDYLVQRLLGRATCQLSPGARLSAKARIRNIAGESSRIFIGSDSIVQGELLVFAQGGSIRLGEWCYIGEQTRIWSAASISIGSRVLIGHNANVFDNLTHPISATERHAQFRRIAKVGHPREISLGERPVSIEDDAWIGAGAFVLRGVTVGTGAIIAAGAVVTKDIPPHSLAAGNPARVLRELSAEER